MNDVLSKTTLEWLGFQADAYKRAFKLFHTEDLELLKAVMDTEQYGRKTQLEAHNGTFFWANYWKRVRSTENRETNNCSDKRSTL